MYGTITLTVSKPEFAQQDWEPVAIQEPTFEDILQLVKQLTPGQKLRLIGAIAPDLEEPLRHAEGDPQPLKSLYGLWKDFGIDLSSKDIDEVRGEMWGNFPRDDI